MRRILSIALFVVLAATVGLEAASRMVHLGRAPLLPYYFVDGAALLPPRLDLEASFYGRPSHRYVTDEGGARIADPSLAAKDPRRGVFVVGDSQSLGYMLDFEDTFASRAAERLLGDPGAARILAAPANQPATLQTAVELYQGRQGVERHRLAVIVCNLGNDLDEMYTEALRWQRQRSGPLHRWLLRHSFVFMDLTLVRAHLLRPGDQPLGVNSILYLLNADERVLLARETVRILDELTAAVEAEDKLLVIIPADYQLSAAEFDKYERYYDDREEFQAWKQQIGTFGLMMSSLESYLARRAEDRGLRVLRLSRLPEVQQPAGPLFDDSSHHLTTYAHGLLTDAIVEAVDDV